MLLAVVLAVTLLVLNSVPVSLGAPEGVTGVIVALALAIPAVGIAIGILREQLFDVRVVLSRTLTYSVISVVSVTAYALSLALASRWLTERADVAASLLTTAVVAIALGSVKTDLEQRVERLLFGARNEPYSVLSGLGAALHTRPGHTDALQAMVGWVQSSLRLPFVAVEDQEGLVVATAGEAVETVDRWPLTFGDRALGTLVAARRGPADPLTEAEAVLLEDAARQVSVAMHALGLAGEVAASRDRLVRAREHERARLRRDLHDGLGPLLAAAILQVDVLRRRLAGGDTDGEGLAARVKDELDRALADVRGLIEGLRPGSLDELGLVGALEQHADALRDAGIDVAIEADVGAAASLAPATEVAIFRIATEAMTNSLRHSQAERVVVRLRAGPAVVELLIADNGTHDESSRSGVGLTSMQERAEELGGRLTVTASREGGTTVEAAIPNEATWTSD